MSTIVSTYRTFAAPALPRPMRALLSTTAAVLTLGLALSTSTSAAAANTVTNASGNGSANMARTTSTVPAAPASNTPPPGAPRRIADAWYAHNAVLAMLGASQRVVVTVARPHAFPWLYRVAPGFGQAEAIDGSTMNAEELLRLNTDLVFTNPGLPIVGALQRAGLKVVPVTFNDFASMRRCIDLTANTLATPFAYQQAQAYEHYLDQTLAEVASDVAAIPMAQRPRVLHVVSVEPLKVDGAHTIVDEWIRAAGGRNAANGLNGNMQTVSIEQVLAWQPDVIILGANAGTLAQSRAAPLWNTLTAVQQHHVYRNPAGVFPWDRYGPEVALQVRWTASMLHPSQASDASLEAQTQAFYRQFFSYPLSSDEARRILAGLPPS